MRRPPPGRPIPASTATTSLLPTAPPREANKRQAYPCQTRSPAADGRKGRTTRLAGARRTTTHGRIAPAMPARRAPRHHLTMSKEHTPPHGPNRAGGAQRGTSLRAAGPGPGPRRPHLPATGKRGLVGLGRLERPTSRLSGVRSNQLSYRPERHPAGPGTRAARAGRCPNLVTAGPHGPTVVCEGTCRRRRAIFTPGRSIKTDPWTSPACRVRAPGGGVPVKSSSAIDDSKCRRRRLHGVPLERR